MVVDDPGVSVVRRLLEGWSELSLVEVTELCDPEIEYTWVPYGVVAEDCHGVYRMSSIGTKEWTTTATLDHVATAGPLIMVARTAFFDHVAGLVPGFAVGVFGAFELRDGRVWRWRDHFDAGQVPMLWST